MSRYSYIFSKVIDESVKEFKNKSQARTVLSRGYSKVQDINEAVMELAKDNRDYILTDTGVDSWKRLLKRYLDDRTRKIKELVRMPKTIFKSMHYMEQDDQILCLEAVFDCMPRASYDSINNLKESVYGRLVLPWTYFIGLSTAIVTQKVQLEKIGKIFDFGDFFETLNEFVDSETNGSRESVVNYLHLKRRTLPGCFEMGKRR